MTGVKQELPDGWELTPLGHALRAAMIAGAERDAAVKRAEEASNDCGWLRITVKELRAENEKLKKRAEGENSERLRLDKLYMTLLAEHDELRAELAKVENAGAVYEDAAKILRAENEKLRGELEEANARAERAELRHERCVAVSDKAYAELEKLRGELAETKEDHAAHVERLKSTIAHAQRHIDQLERECATIAEKTARGQREACAKRFGTWVQGIESAILAMPLATGTSNESAEEELQWKQVARRASRQTPREPLVTDAPSKPEQKQCQWGDCDENCPDHCLAAPAEKT